MKLAQTQAALYRLISGDPAAAPGVIPKIVLGTQPLPAPERVQIYARQYPARMHDALMADFPKLAQVLGPHDFVDLVLAYVAEHPSAHPSLGRLGAALETFLRGRAPAKRRRADLADLAALEWARSEVFVERDAPGVAADALAKVAPERMASCALRLVPGLRVLTLQHDAPALWQALDEGTRLPRVRAGERQVLVWRKGYQVLHAGVSSAEGEALRIAARGRPLAEVFEVFSGRVDAAAAAFEALRSWFAEGLVAAVQLG